jgi:hypothetical protein
MGKVIWLNRTKPVETGIRTKEYIDLSLKNISFLTINLMHDLLDFFHTSVTVDV